MPSVLEGGHVLGDVGPDEERTLVGVPVPAVEVHELDVGVVRKLDDPLSCAKQTEGP